MNWRAVYEFVAPNRISRICAIVSIASIMLPWLILRDWSVNAPPGIQIFVVGPAEHYPLLWMAASFFGLGLHTVIPAISMAALAFIAGAIISWWSAVGGILQVGSVYAIAISLARNDYLLISGGMVEAEYGFNIGFHVGFAAALVTVFSLCPSSRSAIPKAFRRTFKKARPRLS